MRQSQNGSAMMDEYINELASANQAVNGRYDSTTHIFTSVYSSVSSMVLVE